MHGSGGAAAWIVLAVLAWLILITVAAGIGVRYLRSLRPAPRPRPSLPSPLDILERRYAAGEIDSEEFDEARARLRERGIDG